MVGLVILYDHVHPVGAFVKASDVDVSSSFRMALQEYKFFRLNAKLVTIQ